MPRTRNRIVLGLGCAALLALAWGAVDPRVWLAVEADGTKAPNLGRATQEASQKRISDGAGTLGHFVAYLERSTGYWMKHLGIDAHVVTVNSPDAPVDELAPELFESRRIGAEAPTGGLLVLMNPAREEARIEVSYELEGIFPDALLGQLAEGQLAPYASYDAGGMAVMDVLGMLREFALQKAIRGDLELDEKLRRNRVYREMAAALSGGGGAHAALPEVPTDTNFKARIEGERRRRYAPSEEAMESAEAFLRVQHDLAGDPSLTLFTPGSRVQRAISPVAPYEELDRWAKAEASRPLKLIQRGNRAIVTSESPALGFWPILLHRLDGTWRVDMVELFKNISSQPSGHQFQKNVANPYSFGLRGFGQGGAHPGLEPLDLGGRDLAKTLATLQAQPDALSKYLAAELLFRNAFVFVEALRYYQEAVRLAPEAPLFVDTYARRAEYVSFSAVAASEYEKLGPSAYRDLARTRYDVEEMKSATEWGRKAVLRNPYDREALLELRSIAAFTGHRGEIRKVDDQLRKIRESEHSLDNPVTVAFSPERPTLIIDRAMTSGGHALYDHATFGATLTNTSGRPVTIDRVDVATGGTGGASNFGDLKGRWIFPSGQFRLEPGESTHFESVWGFPEDTDHVQLSYRFETCWRGIGSDVSQCREERLDLFPD